MIGPKSVPSPSSSVTSDAISLLITIGQDKSAVSRKLGEILDVQKHNEQVLEEAKQTLAQAEKRIAKASEDEDTLRRNRDSLALDMREKEQKLQKDKERFEAKVGATNTTLEQKKARLAEKATALGKLEGQLNLKAGELDRREAKIQHTEAALESAISQANKKAAELDKKLSDLKNIVA